MSGVSFKRNLTRVEEPHHSRDGAWLSFYPIGVAIALVPTMTGGIRGAIRSDQIAVRFRHC